jgi:excisionase family DNA binding protein
VARHPADPAAATAAALRAANEASAPLTVAFELELTPEFVNAVAARLAVLVRAEQHQQPSSPWMKPEEAAAYLRCDKQRLYDLVHQDRIPHEKEGGRLLFNRAQLDDYVRRGGKR